MKTVWLVCSGSACGVDAGDQNARAAILQHELDSLLWIGRIERNKACPGFYDRKECDDGIS